MSKASATTKAAATALLSRDSAKPANLKATTMLAWEQALAAVRSRRREAAAGRCRQPKLRLGCRISVGRELAAGLHPRGDHTRRIAVRVVDVFLAGKQAVTGVDQPGPVREPERLSVRVGRVVEQVLDHDDDGVIVVVVGNPVAGKAHVRERCHDRHDPVPYRLAPVKDAVVMLGVDHILGE